MTRSFSASAVAEECDFIKSFTIRPYARNSTPFQKDNICTAVESIFRVRQECAKCSENKLLRRLCRMHLTSADTRDQLPSLEACCKVLHDKIAKTVF